MIFNFDNADLEVVIQAASEMAGFNYVLEPEVKGKKVTVQTPGRIAQEDVLNVLLAILEVHGVTAIKAGDVYKIVRIEGAPERPVPTVIGPDPDPGRPGDEVVTQIVPLRFASATDLNNLLRPMVSGRGSLTAHRQTNLLVVTDAASNIRRVLEVVKLVDVRATVEELQVIPLKFADAQEVATILNQLFASGIPSTTAGPPSPPPAPPAAPPAPRGAAAAPARPSAEAASPERGAFITAYRGINVLVVRAQKTEMETIRQLIAKLDVDSYGGRSVFIYFAENTKARELAATMNAIHARGEGGPAVPPSPLAPPRGAPSTPPSPGRPPGSAGGAEGGLGDGEVRFIADEVSNAVIVQTYPRNWPALERTLKTLDRTPRQVLIEVRVVEVALIDDTSLGIEWALRRGRFDITQSSSGTLPARPSFPIPSPQQVAVTPGLTIFTFAAETFLAFLNALATENKLNVLSSPSIMTAENKKAVINVSNSIPIATASQIVVGQATSTGGTPITPITQNIEYKDVGIILTVTPRIGEKGTVALDIKQEVNDVVGSLQAITPTNPPTFTKREAETSVVLLDNQTLVMGGLIKNQRTVARTGVPILSKIPLLGALFGTTTESIQKTELLILLTPRVIGTVFDAARVTEEMQRITPRIEQFIKEAPRPMSPRPVTPPPPLED